MTTTGGGGGGERDAYAFFVLSTLFDTFVVPGNLVWSLLGLQGACEQRRSFDVRVALWSPPPTRMPDFDYRTLAFANSSDARQPVSAGILRGR
jgi:hypothetical protein